jgi:hypothetical protein
MLLITINKNGSNILYHLFGLFYFINFVILGSIYNGIFIREIYDRVEITEEAI